ncbi:MAG: prepilin-type N-terminal cleavage/methylation domain-containing protein [Nitrospinae bacterium]|nr:prepilin-type N-terminal cleavage/methylation domain-containing protein [Nitrospinota bacterium]
MRSRYSRPGLFDTAGFTLLEVVVAMAILSIALVTLLSANNKALLMNAEAVSLTDAVTLGREEMEKLYMGQLPEAGVSEKKTREDYPAYAWRVEVKETPFGGVWETGVYVFGANDGKERRIFRLKAYMQK